MRRRNRGPTWRRKLHRTPPLDLSHQSLEDFINSSPAGDRFGDNPETRPQSSLRIYFQNIQTAPEDPNAEKQQQLERWLRSSDIGIALFAELNRFWPVIPIGRKWRDRMRKVSTNGFYCKTAWNSNQSRSYTSSQQAGGCSAAVFGQTSHGVRAGGQDSTGLGRFAWIRIEGRTIHHQQPSEGPDQRARTKDLIVVSAYRPCRPGGGLTTVWAQQRLYFASKGRYVDPREAFIIDLLQVVDDWRAEGCEIVVGLDANEDLTSTSDRSLRHRFSLSGLDEVVLSRHRGIPPATQIDNTKNEPIDGIFATEGVRILQSGYYDFSEAVPSDHRAVWTDIDLFSTLGGFIPTASHPIRRLSVKNRRARRKYIKLAEAGYLKYNIYSRLNSLHEKLEESGWVMTSSLARQFNSVHSQSRMIRRLAESKCHKVCRGGQPWSPQSQALRDQRDLWKLLLHRAANHRISSRKLRRLIAKTREYQPHRLSVDELQAKLSEVQQLLNEAKCKNLAKWREEHLDKTTRIANRAVKKTKTRYNRERSEALRSMRQREETQRRRRA